MHADDSRPSSPRRTRATGPRKDGADTPPAPDLPHSTRPREDLAVLQRCRRLIRELPPIRIEKIRAVQDALRKARYDDEAAIEATIDRLTTDVSALLAEDRRA